MLRIVHLVILPGVLLAACSVWGFADTTRPSSRVAVDNKSVYSNRPIGYTMPIPYYGTPMAPRFLVPPVTQYYYPVTVALSADGSEAGMKAVEPFPEVSAPQVVEKIFILREPQPEVSVNNELDASYARLAKIHVEKHQLAEALALIQKIKSETFKVRTVVNLAEYVSRDKNYQTEADRLFQLALASMEALDRGQPFRVDSGNMDVRQPVLVPDIMEQPLTTAPTPPTPPVGTPGTGGPRPILWELVDDPPTTVTPPPEAPPVVSPVGPTPPTGPPLIPAGDAGNNGRLYPPPSPPRGNGVDGGIVVSPPEIPVSPEVAPPASPSLVSPPPAIPLEDAPKTPENTPSQETGETTRRLPRIILEEN